MAVTPTTPAAAPTIKSSLIKPVSVTIPFCFTDSIVNAAGSVEKMDEETYTLFKKHFYSKHFS